MPKRSQYPRAVTIAGGEFPESIRRTHSRFFLVSYVEKLSLFGLLFCELSTLLTFDR